MASKGYRRVILWLRNDLRVNDHEPLLAAIKDAGGEVVPVYFFDPRQYRMTKYGFRKTGPLRSKFTIECVADLRESLRKLGMGPIVLSLTLILSTLW
jgi:deoxyribodipyrimidine photo-lyase